MNLISIIFYLLLLDAVTAVFLAFTGKLSLFTKFIPSLSRFLPEARRWTLVYLALVFLAGAVLTSSGLLVVFW